MNKAIFSIFLSLILLSCNTNQIHEQKIAARSLPVAKFPKKSSPVKSNDTITFSKAKCPVTQLPFGPTTNRHHLYKSGKFYDALIYKDVTKLIVNGWTPKFLKNINVYQLPPIKKITYTGLSYIDTGRCTDGQPFGNFLKLAGYRYRLPDIQNYRCYYWCTYDYFNSGYSEKVKQNCDQCLINCSYGYLILYNESKQEAKVITIYFDTFRDGSNHYRYFYIDKNYNIHLADYSQEADDGDGSTPSSISAGKKIVISISNKGDFIVNKDI